MPASITIDVQLIEETAPALLKHFGQPKAWESGPPPNAHGVYCWTSDRRILYIGKGEPLSKRLAYQADIDAHDPVSDWAVSVIHMLKRFNATLQWIATSDEGEAALLERRLIEWHRACTGIAPIVVGWDAKKGTQRYAAEQWARDLYNEGVATSVQEVAYSRTCGGTGAGRRD
ncbi:hypothetical protein KGQ20_07315 [Catenulispora sp. NF23]|uniref:hypothetical protein n=1 Tax=Catenulispora pinistramenti TaxID=2705254 RepID=UPI001BABBE5F|nr:hypothetical protein [Catenulispora pinistramenti]MBS2532578.1 hypothetical protein [Catenulispora pinistramenti]